MNRSRFFLLAFTLMPFILFSQVLEPVKWSFKVEPTKAGEVTLLLISNSDRGWHTYSQEVIPEGPVPTEFTFIKSPDYELLGKVVEPKGVKEKDPQINNMVVTYFPDRAVFKQKIKVIGKKDFTIKGNVYFMCCNDRSCIAPTEAEFEFAIKGNPETSATTQPQPEKTSPAQKGITAADATTQNAATTDTSKAGKACCSAKQDSAKISRFSAVPAGTEENKSLLVFFLISFLAGLAAIVTPCVFPMIPMTVTFFMKGSENKRKGRMQAIVYGLSIIVIYTVIGTVVAVTLGANFANFLSTHWIPNVFFFLIFMVFAASFLGMFEITLPSWLVNKADKQADKGGYTGAFFMAFTLVLVSFSCTGPIVGAILVKSASGQILQPIIGMLGFSLAFALPFALFAFFPSWLAGLPKSGGWLNSVKVVLGFLEIALGLKFLSIADQTYHWHILDREVYLAMWIITFTLMGFYLLGKLKFHHDSDLPFISVPRLLLAIITFSFVMYMVPGMFGAPLKALSGYLPPETSLDFDLTRIIREEVKAFSGSGTGGNTTSALCEKPRYGDFLKLPHGLDGYFDYKQGLSCAKKLNKPLFIDFTGHGCVNCREMEANVWSAPPVLQRLREKFIVTALYVDDKTEVPANEWVTSKYDGKVKKSIGKIYADLQISGYNINSQPYYVLLDTSGNLLAQPRAYNLNVDEFVKWLDGALDNFRKQQKK
ncbi:MAG: thioredoxin family protein [Bacteroidetes bacterium]|nr:thioredoxin family protein [Bacteroidota bacterium]